MTLLAMRSGCDRKRPFCSDYMALMDFARTRSQILATRKTSPRPHRGMSALGHERTSRHVRVMSALPPITEVGQGKLHTHGKPRFCGASCLNGPFQCKD